MGYIAKWASQALLILAALLSGSYSLIDLLGMVGANGTVQIFGLPISGDKTHVEFTVRVVASVAALGLIGLTDAFEVIFPKRRMREFRKAYLDLQAPQWKGLLAQNDIRVSLLYAKRRWYWPFWKSFEWVWNDGFAPPNWHFDANMPLATWQGISGQSYNSGEPKALRLDDQLNLKWYQRWLFANAFFLTGWQLKKTEKLKYMLSIPLLRSSGGASPSHKPVGVINVDACTDAGADFLDTNSDDLSEYFLNAGRVLSLLRL